MNRQPKPQSQPIESSRVRQMAVDSFREYRATLPKSLDEATEQKLKQWFYKMFNGIGET